MNEDEKELFRQAVVGAKPLERDRHEPARLRPRPQAIFRRADEQAVLDESLTHHAADLGVETGDEILFRRPGLPERLLRDLRRGRFAIEDELDLHGHTAAEAEAKTDFFISRAKNSRLKTIRIITGKGLHSPQGPVLQGVVEAKLLEFRAQKKIIAYRWENNAKQKSGALIVYLA